MEVNLNIENRKKIIGKIAVIFLIVVLLLTFFSKTINNLLLAEVECTSPYSGTLDKGSDEMGTISKESASIYSRGNWKIEKLNVTAGSYVKIGDVLAVIDQKKAEMNHMNLKLDVMRTENSLENYKDSFSASGMKKSDEYYRNVDQMEYELKIKKLELANFEAALPPNGEIKAEIPGTLGSVSVMQGKSVFEGDEMFSIAKENGKVMVTWKLGSSKASAVNRGDTVNVKVTEPEEAFIDAKVTDKSFLSQEGLYEFTAELDTELDLQYGQQATVVMGQSGTEFDSIVPTSAVIQDTTGTYVYTVETSSGALGEEEHVKKLFVTILDQDDFNTAVKGLEEKEGISIVSYSTKFLYDGVQVKTNK